MQSTMLLSVLLLLLVAVDAGVVVVVVVVSGVAFIISFLFDIEYTPYILFRCVKENGIFLCFGITYPIYHPHSHMHKQIETRIINTDMHSRSPHCSL